MSDRLTIREALKLAWANFKHERYDYSAEICRRVLAAEPQNVIGLHILALSLNRLGAVGAAAEHLAQAVALAPKNEALRADLAAMLQTLGRVEEAVEMARSALELAPHYASAHSGLVYVMMFDPRFDAEAIYQ